MDCTIVALCAERVNEYGVLAVSPGGCWMIYFAGSDSRGGWGDGLGFGDLHGNGTGTGEDWREGEWYSGDDLDGE